MVVADDEHLFRGMLVQNLRSNGVDVVGEAADAAQLLAVVREALPDLVLTDQRMPRNDHDAGLRAAIEVRRIHQSAGVVLLSAYGEVRYATELLTALQERVGYILKQDVHNVTELIPLMERVAAGGVALDPRFVSQLIQRPRRENPLQRLTPHELRILALMAEGLSNAAIAQQIAASEGAVEKAVTALNRKLAIDGTNANRRVTAVLAFLRHTGRLAAGPAVE